MAKSEKKKPATRPRKPKKARPALKLAAAGSGASVLDRLFAVVESRRTADPTISHSARLLSRGPAKVAQKFGEEAVECLIEAVAGNRDALIAESADVLYHLTVLWVSTGIAEKASRAKPLATTTPIRTTKIP